MKLLKYCLIATLLGSPIMANQNEDAIEALEEIFNDDASTPEE